MIRMVIKMQIGLITLKFRIKSLVVEILETLKAINLISRLETKKKSQGKALWVVRVHLDFKLTRPEEVKLMKLITC